jgi:hypothetical protein
LITQVVSEVLGRTVTVAENPKADAATGAALVAAGRTARVADSPAVGTGEAAGEPTRIMPAVPDRIGDEPAPLRPAPSPASASVLPLDRTAASGWRRYRTAGLIAAGAAAIAALLVG